MNRYIAQKAGEALEAMCGKHSLTRRLRNARLCFAVASTDAFLSTASDGVRDSIIAFMKSKGRGPGCTKSAALAKSAICLTLLEFGRCGQKLSDSIRKQTVRS